jgi:hypothetical protein
MARLPVALCVFGLALLAAGCSSGSRHTTSAAAPTTCKLTTAQRRTIALARADIRRLRRIQAPVQTFSERGVPGQVTVTGKFMVDLGSTKLPINVFSHLLHQAKTAASLCGDCGKALESEEPVLGNRGIGHGATCG